MKRRFAGCLLGLCALAALVGGGGLALVRNGRKPAAPPGAKAVRFAVPAGASAAALGRELEARGVIRSAFVWERLLARNARIRPGIYDLSPAETPEAILGHLTRGEIATVRVTFPEGFTLKQIAARLHRKGLIADQESFLRQVTTRGDALPASFAPPRNLEGFLFPDTYRIPVGATQTEIAARLLGNFDRLVARGLAGPIEKSGRSLVEIVTIASMIEREAETEGDRPKIASVIYNRLRRGMRLEIDATVQYARGEHKSRLLFRDLAIDSPYNTYRRAGLPPGPICCPGLPSLRAALAPTRSDYLFYVARSDGSHVFSRTFAEHRQNIARLRRGGA